MRNDACLDTVKPDIHCQETFMYSSLSPTPLLRAHVSTRGGRHRAPGIDPVWLNGRILLGSAAIAFGMGAASLAASPSATAEAGTAAHQSASTVKSRPSTPHRTDAASKTGADSEKAPKTARAPKQKPKNSAGTEHKDRKSDDAPSLKKTVSGNASTTEESGTKTETVSHSTKNAKTGNIGSKTLAKAVMTSTADTETKPKVSLLDYVFKNSVPTGKDAEQTSTNTDTSNTITGTFQVSDKEWDAVEASLSKIPVYGSVTLTQGASVHGVTTMNYHYEVTSPSILKTGGQDSFTVSLDDDVATNPFHSANLSDLLHKLTGGLLGAPAQSSFTVTVNVAKTSAPVQDTSFFDDFNGPAGSAPDPAYWTADDDGWRTNGEKGVFDNSTRTAFLDGNGNLVIRAIQTQPGQFITARLTTRDKVEMGLGTLSARIQVPAGEGLWPAFWTLGSNVTQDGWPKSGEIDVMEVWNAASGQPTTNHTNVISYQNSALGVTAQQMQNTYSGDDLTSGFHTFWMKREVGKVTIGIDDTTVSTVTEDQMANWPFDEPVYAILNIAVGGTMPQTTPGADFTQADMLVD